MVAFTYVFFNLPGHNIYPRHLDNIADRHIHSFLISQQVLIGAVMAVSGGPYYTMDWPLFS